MNYYQGYYGMPQQQSYYPSQQNYIGLNGKVVDGQDMVKATDVPIGSFGVFPKGDLSEIYIKSWNENGTTSITTYKPSKSDEQNLLERVAILEEQINKLVGKGNKEDVINEF